MFCSLNCKRSQDDRDGRTFLVILSEPSVLHLWEGQKWFMDLPMTNWEWLDWNFSLLTPSSCSFKAPFQYRSGAINHILSWDVSYIILLGYKYLLFFNSQFIVSPCKARKGFLPLFGQCPVKWHIRSSSQQILTSLLLLFCFCYFSVAFLLFPPGHDCNQFRILIFVVVEIPTIVFSTLTVPWYKMNHKLRETY